MDIDEWRVILTRERGTGCITIALYGVEDDGQLSDIGSQLFGPFDTAHDVLKWLVRHWAPRARLPLR